MGLQDEVVISQKPLQTFRNTIFLGGVPIVPIFSTSSVKWRRSKLRHLNPISHGNVACCIVGLLTGYLNVCLVKTIKVTFKWMDEKVRDVMVKQLGGQRDYIHRHAMEIEIFRRELEGHLGSQNGIIHIVQEELENGECRFLLDHCSVHTGNDVTKWIESCGIVVCIEVIPDRMIQNARSSNQLSSTYSKPHLRTNGDGKVVLQGDQCRRWILKVFIRNGPYLKAESGGGGKGDNETKKEGLKSSIDLHGWSSSRTKDDFISEKDIERTKVFDVTSSSCEKYNTTHES